MPTRHTIVQGEGVSSLADKHGLFASTIWNDPANAELKEQRKDMNVLMPGDVVVIPDKRDHPVTRPTGTRHVFRRRGIPVLFRLQVFDVEEPRANQMYRLTIDGRSRTGTTDGDGVLEEYVPTDSKEGELVIGEDEFTILIDFGHLDPVSEISGVQKRLINLGFFRGEPDGKLDDLTRAALLAFQIRFELEETGEPDDKTLKKLEEVYDTPLQFPEFEDT